MATNPTKSRTNRLLKPTVGNARDHVLITNNDLNHRDTLSFESTSTDATRKVLWNGKAVQSPHVGGAPIIITPGHLSEERTKEDIQAQPEKEYELKLWPDSKARGFHVSKFRNNVNIKDNTKAVLWRPNMATRSTTTTKINKNKKEGPGSHLILDIGDKAAEVKGDGQKSYEGYIDGQTSKYVLLGRDGNTFYVIPVENWYTFNMSTASSGDGEDADKANEIYRKRLEAQRKRMLPSESHLDNEEEKDEQVHKRTKREGGADDVDDEIGEDEKITFDDDSEHGEKSDEDSDTEKKNTKPMNYDSESDEEQKLPEITKDKVLSNDGKAIQNMLVIKERNDDDSDASDYETMEETNPPPTIDTTLQQIHSTPTALNLPNGLPSGLTSTPQPLEPPAEILVDLATLPPPPPPAPLEKLPVEALLNPSTPLPPIAGLHNKIHKLLLGGKKMSFKDVVKQIITEDEVFDIIKQDKVRKNDYIKLNTGLIKQIMDEICSYEKEGGTVFAKLK